MNFRSTNDNGYIHRQGDYLTNVSSGGVQNSSHGVFLTGGSTGGLVTACGDETNVTLNVAGKGTGAVVIGNSSSPVILGNNAVVISTGGILQVGSTAPFGGFIRFTDTGVALPYFNTTNRMVMETTHTITGANSSCLLVANGVNLSTDAVIVNAFCGSTAGQVHTWILKTANTSVATGATGTIQFTVYRF